MKSIIYTKYGKPDVLALRDVDKPTPLDDEVLVEVHAASVNAYDWHYLTADIFLIRLMGGGLFKPKKTTLGADISGKIVSVGKGIKRFKAGDEIFGFAKGGRGGFAEFVCAREKSLQLKPSNISFDEAAAVPMAALTALQGLRDLGQIKPGERVLIHGASGGVGTFAIQIAKFLGANVTAVCSSGKVEIARAIGADLVIDYRKEDFSGSGEPYDLIMVANGNRSIRDYIRSLKPNGICVLAGGGSGSLLKMLFSPLQNWWILKTEKKKVCSFLAKITQEDLAYLKDLLASGQIKPVIDKVYKLEETAQALRHLGEGHAKGKIIVKMEHGGNR